MSFWLPVVVLIAVGILVGAGCGTRGGEGCKSSLAMVLTESSSEVVEA